MITCMLIPGPPITGHMTLSHFSPSLSALICKRKKNGHLKAFLGEVYSIYFEMLKKVGKTDGWIEREYYVIKQVE